MSTMIRKQIYVKPDQDAKLKEIAARFRVSESELIREGIDRALMHPAATYPDKNAWEKITDYIGRLSGKKHAKGQRKWKREDMYDRFKK